MKVEIWLDVLCPFCYIGKRKFENALEQFANKENVQVEWRSFQLDPNLQYVHGKSIDQVLADKKGLSRDQAKQMNAQVTRMAKEVGLDYKFDHAKPANTFDAHRLSHLAAKYKLQEEVEEKLFLAYFTEGKNIGDKETLIQLGIEIGLPEAEVRKTIESDAYANEVKIDAHEAQEIGVRGVPFFVIDRKYAVSGAQSSEVFTAALETAWREFEKNNLSAINSGEDNSCNVNG